MDKYVCACAVLGPTGSKVFPMTPSFSPFYHVGNPGSQERGMGPVCKGKICQQIPTDFTEFHRPPSNITHTLFRDSALEKRRMEMEEEDGGIQGPGSHPPHPVMFPKQGEGRERHVSLPFNSPPPPPPPRIPSMTQSPPTLSREEELISLTRLYQAELYDSVKLSVRLHRSTTPTLAYKEPRANIDRSRLIRVLPPLIL